MAATKTATLNLRVDPALKDAVQKAAAKDHRSVANLVEVLIREHCERIGVSIKSTESIRPMGERGSRARKAR